MSTLNYLFRIVGEPPERRSRLHPSTVRRIRAQAIAIHIPVMLWGMTGFILASNVFGFGLLGAVAVGFACAVLIYLVERLVLVTPKTWYVNSGRVAIGVVIAVLGASSVDLVIFDREVVQQLRAAGETRISAEFDREIAKQVRAVHQAKTDWLGAREAANCEANGTCGSRIRNVGPVYRELAAQAAQLRGDYEAAKQRLQTLTAGKARAIEEWRSSRQAVQQAGLLARMEALHEYVVHNRAAFAAWLLFFLLVLFFESLVVLVKLVFGDTVDDEIEEIQERVSQRKAQAYFEAVTSPVAEARRLLDATYS